MGQMHGDARCGGSPSYKDCAPLDPSSSTRRSSSSPRFSEMRAQSNFTDPPIHGHSSLADPLPRGSPLWQDAPVLPPGSIEEFHLCQPLCNHGGKHQAKKDTAD